MSYKSAWAVASSIQFGYYGANNTSFFPIGYKKYDNFACGERIASTEDKTFWFVLRRKENYFVVRFDVQEEQLRNKSPPGKSPLEITVSEVNLNKCVIYQDYDDESDTIAWQLENAQYETIYHRIFDKEKKNNSKLGEMGLSSARIMEVVSVTRQSFPVAFAPATKTPLGIILRDWFSKLASTVIHNRRDIQLKNARNLENTVDEKIQE